MDIVMWVLTGVLAGMMLIAGVTKLATSYPALVADPGMAWAGGFTPVQVNAIAVVEVLGAVGVVLPWFLDVAPVLTPIAALGLSAVMIGAVAVHARRKEWSATTLPGALGVLGVVVGVLRFAELS